MVLNVHRRRDRALCSLSRVWLDGIEVTDRCAKFDRRRGRAWLYEIPLLVCGDAVAVNEHRGRVVVKRTVAT